ETLSLLLPGGAQHSGVNLDEDEVLWRAFELLRNFSGLSCFWRLCSDAMGYCKIGANSEQVKGQMSFVTFAVTYSVGNQLSDGSFVGFAWRGYPDGYWRLSGRLAISWCARITNASIFCCQSL